MYISRLAYYADFVIHSLFVLACTGVMVWRGSAWERADWFFAAGVGLILWTLLEYLLHRFVFHRVAFFARMHDRHHQAPTALVATPLWGTILIALFGFFVPSYLAVGFYLGCAVTAGLLSGYIWYGVVHHVVHHWTIGRGSFFYTAKLRHARHHYNDEHDNFGVTTSFWDRVFDMSHRHLFCRLPSAGDF